MDDENRTAEAILFVGHRVEAIGSAREIRSLAARGTAIVDLAGRTVVPGLIDAHAHVEFCALSRQLWLDVRGLSATQAVEKIKREASRG